MIRHRAEIQRSRQCGCFYCGAIFAPNRITEWTDTENPHDQQTALCPACGIDSVIGDLSGFPVTAEFMQEMKTWWFGDDA